ncbi:ABC transporter permease [Paenibacillus swuensis]|uniref:ABC transporter permease n=1 Tax=Paenibacillus swuensis TaxID=1178515 RepID=A0A172TIX1_9BACL|nr:carbohydrate ABC transporter permease [Paenibacillus swuensis]ANE47005.1 ABC transporter permease [Paenibacillus swuensis]
MSTAFTKRFSSFDWILIGLLFLVMVSSFAPILHTISVSFSNQAKADSGLVTLFPIGFNLNSYEKIVEDRQFLTAFWVSVKRVFWVALLSFVVTVLTAYPLAQDPRQFRFRNPVMWLLVFIMLFNGGLVPFYMAVKSYHMYNTMFALVLPNLFSVFNIILVVNFFRSLPRELEESASMDGAGPWRMLWNVIIPLSVPVLATITLFNIVGTWNEYLSGLIFIRDQELVPLQTYMQTLFVKMDPTQLTAENVKQLSEVSNKTLSAAKTFVSLIPILLIYPFLQRYFITGIMLGSVKE